MTDLRRSLRRVWIRKAIGFNADIKSKNEYNIGDVLKHALPQDFVKFGLIRSSSAVCR